MPPPQRPGAFRRKLIIYPQIQVPLIALSGGLALLGALFSASFIVYMQNHPDQNEAQTRVVFVLLGLLIFSSYAILMSYYTNRLFGPIYRLQMTMKKEAEGLNPGPIRLRDGDHFSEVVDEYNKVLEHRIPKS